MKNMHRSGLRFGLLLIGLYGINADRTWHNPNRIAVTVQVAKDNALSRRETQESCRRSNKVEFVEYVPSPWEIEWRDHAAQYEENVCKWMQKDTDKVEHWMKIAAAYNSTGPTPALLSKFKQNTFSKFVYRSVCRSNGLPRTLEVPIEPLVGHLRNPYWNMYCKFPSSPETPVNVENRDYIIVNPIPAKAFESMYTGRRYLIDMGTSYYNTSLNWMTAHYGALGIEFDEIWAWEMSTELSGNDPYKNYWKYVPAELRPKLHFYNFEITEDISAADFPMNIIKNIYKPGDFIVVKMDVEGNDVLEEGMIKPFLQEPGTASMVAEFFYELHMGKAIFNVEEHVTLEDAVQAFHKLRKRGLRIHYWP